MAPRKRSKNDAGASSSHQAFDDNLFVSERAFERYKLLSVKNVIQNRGMECKEEYRHEPQYDEIKRAIVSRGGKNWSMSDWRKNKIPIPSQNWQMRLKLPKKN